MPTKAQLLLARNQNAQPQETVEAFADEDTRALEEGHASVARVGFGKVRVFKLTPAGSVPVEVPVQALGQVLRDGYSPVCFDCGQEECGPGVNDCPGRAPKRYRVCPVQSCGKVIYDPMPTGVFRRDEFDNGSRGPHAADENAIQDDAYQSSTPESRTRAAMDLHIIGYHASTAMELGIKRPALAGGD